MNPWEIQGRELINCNCCYACPCQFNALPNNGFCEALGAVVIDRGHYGTTSLDGLKLAVIFKWPGPIHEGKGQCQPIVDIEANEAQRSALLKIMSGQDTDPFATMFAVFATTLETVFEPIVSIIEFDVDVDARRGRIQVPGVLEVQGQPIRNPVTGDEHRVRIDLPHGFEYEIAEIGSGTGRSEGKLVVTLNDTYAQFAQLHMNNHGLIRHRTAA